MPNITAAGPLVEAAQAQQTVRLTSILESNKDWKDKYGKLMHMLECGNPELERRAQITLKVMENQRLFMEGIKGNAHLEATFTQNLPGLVPKVIDLVRIFYPNLIANVLVDIQPMDRQNGEIFIVKPIYSNTAAGVTAGQQIFTNPTDGTYSSETVTAALGTGDGALVTFGATLAPAPVRKSSITITAAAVTGTDNGSGAITGTGIASGTINYVTGALSVTFSVAPAGAVAVSAIFTYDSETSADQIREVELQLSLIPVTAVPHPLRVKWSTQAQLGAAAHLDLDVPDTLANLVASFIKVERDTLLINLIINAATVDATLNFDAAASANYSRLAKYAEIELKLNYAESAIQAAQGRGGISWVLAGNNAADIWRNVNGFVPSGVVAPIGPHVIGTLRDGTVTVVKVPAMSTNTYVVGFKGYVVGDAATILAEWVPLYASPVFNSYDLNNYQGMMSLYALVLNQSGYYRKGTISNYAA